MGRSVRRTGQALIVALTLALAALTLLAPAPASAAPATTSVPAVAATAAENRESRIIASYPRLGGIAVSLRPSARLTDATTGLPLAGQEVVFWIGDAFFPSCTAVTDANGVARCSGAQLQWQVLLSRSYEAVFGATYVGEIYYDTSRDTATLLTR